MPGRAGAVRAVHSASSGAYCLGSGADALPFVAPTAAPPPSVLAAAPPVAAALEREVESFPASAVRHFGGALDLEGRVEAVRRLSSIGDLAELEALGGALQAKVLREIERQKKALEAVEAAGVEAIDRNDQRDLKRLAARQDYQARVGVMARARALFAQLHGRGVQVDHELQPAEPTPGELEAELTAQTAPAELADLAAWICRHTGQDSAPAPLVVAVRDLTSTVRGSRATIPACDNVSTVILAYQYEAQRPAPRETILNQLEARITALGGDLPVRAAAQPEPQPEPADRLAPALDVDALAHAGVPALPLAGLDGLARREAAASTPVTAWDLSSLPIAERIAQSMRRAALELVGDLADLGQVDAAISLETAPAGMARGEVLAALQERRRQLEVAAAPAAPVAEPVAPVAPVAKPVAPVEAPVAAVAAVAPPQPAPVSGAAPSPAAPVQAVQVRDLRRVDLPDGRAELWACREGARPIRLGYHDDPRLAPHRAALDAAAQRQAAPPVPAARQPTAPDGLAALAAALPALGALADQVTAAQAGLAALAAGLPALHALGLDVEIKITTRRG
jgi:hypothetical protein